MVGASKQGRPHDHKELNNFLARPFLYAPHMLLHSTLWKRLFPHTNPDISDSGSADETGLHSPANYLYCSSDGMLVNFDS